MQEGNSMREIEVEKVTVNMGVSPEAPELKSAQQIIERVTGKKAVQTKCKVKQPKWNIRPGLPIGLKVTLREKEAEEFLSKALKAKDNTLQNKNFDRQGNFGFGIAEYIDMPDTKYDPKLGVRGFDVLVTLKRPGFRVKRRKKRQAKIGKNHRIGKKEAIGFMAEKFGVAIQ